ncbi:MAG: hypothetical protein WDW36_009185 [Sanguina aurantia]
MLGRCSSSALQLQHHRSQLNTQPLHIHRGFATRPNQKPSPPAQKGSPAQTPKQQQKKEEQQEHRINNGISAPMLRVVFPNRSAMVMNRSAALAAAKALALDLVIVNGTADPPIAKILNYQELLQQQADAAKAAAGREKEALRLSAGKELRIGHNIGDNDLATKVRKATDILKDGYRLTLLLEFKSPEDKDEAGQALNYVISQLAEFGVPDKPRTVMKRAHTTVLRPTGHCRIAAAAEAAAAAAAAAAQEKHHHLSSKAGS